MMLKLKKKKKKAMWPYSQMGNIENESQFDLGDTDFNRHIHKCKLMNNVCF